MTRKKTFLLAVSAIALSCVFCLILFEVFLRFMPVATGSRMESVTRDSPVARFTPNRPYTWSDEWNFAIVNHGRANNDGFINDQDYDAADPRPLMAVIGDSYVEALMIPYPRTIHGILADKAGPDHRVYSFAASGAPLSQYLIWARYARETYKADKMTFVIIGNDFDESLPQYYVHQLFHQFVEDDKGELTPVLLNEFHRSWKSDVIKLSAVARYTFFNLNAWLAWSNFKQMILRRESDVKYVANTDASTDETRMKDSKRAVDAFFRLLPAYAGLKAMDIAFVFDSSRGWIYLNDPSEKQHNYFDEMRNYFMTTAQKLGYTVIDMDKPFEADFRKHHEKFEFPTDGHWNARGHALAAGAVAETKFFKDFVRD